MGSDNAKESCLFQSAMTLREVNPEAKTIGRPDCVADILGKWLSVLDGRDLILAKSEPFDSGNSSLLSWFEKNRMRPPVASRRVSTATRKILWFMCSGYLRSSSPIYGEQVTRTFGAGCSSPLWRVTVASRAPKLIRDSNYELGSTRR
jgi:hypothetical protein